MDRTLCMWRLKSAVVKHSQGTAAWSAKGLADVENKREGLWLINSQSHSSETAEPTHLRHFLNFFKLFSYCKLSKHLHFKTFQNKICTTKHQKARTSMVWIICWNTVITTLTTIHVVFLLPFKCIYWLESVLIKIVYCCAVTARTLLLSINSQIPKCQWASERCASENAGFSCSAQQHNTNNSLCSASSE